MNLAGSDEGGRRAAAIYRLIATAKLNDIDSLACFADALARLPGDPVEAAIRSPTDWLLDSPRCTLPAARDERTSDGIGKGQI